MARLSIEDAGRYPSQVQSQVAIEMHRIVVGTVVITVVVVNIIVLIITFQSTQTIARSGPAPL